MKITFCRFNLMAVILSISVVFTGSCQETANQAEEPSDSTSNQVFLNTEFHKVPDLQFPEDWDPDIEVKNVILMVGDGMGITQVFAGAVANKGKLNVLNFPNTGFSSTRSSDSDVTDSAAGATAFACGVKTYNGAIGVDTAGVAVETILEMAEKNGLATGLVATCRITHATPASFIAHQPSRQMYESIAEDFLKTDIDVFIGGGRENFNKRRDGHNLLDSLSQKGYQVVNEVDSLQFVEGGKVAGLIHEGDQERYSDGRGPMLQVGTETALKILDQDPDGFFLMIEGSQIDWGGHANDTGYIVQEMLDFDNAIGIVLDYALNNPGTLVIVTADHETGGFSLIDIDRSIGKVEGAFSTNSHTGVLVPVFAFGPQSDKFTGTYENNEIFFKMKEALGFD